MINLLLGISAICILIFIVSSTFMPDIFHTEKENGEKEKPPPLCSKCITGRQSYKLDEHSEFCPYISCCTNGECCYFKPVKKTTVYTEEKSL